MQRGIVMGPIVSTKRLWDGPRGALLEIQLAPEYGGGMLVAFDALGCGTGERVLVTTGSAAAAWFPGQSPPIDALIIGSIN
jgi:microcompartment protein CcmK/EutM